MTWLSTVSPRALERLIEEAAPGTSLFPTLTRLDSTHTGNVGGAVWTPTPLRFTIAGELVALLATLTVPLKLPAAVGANKMFIVIG